MQWSMVEIEDLKGKVYTGDAASDFVLDKIKTTVIVKNFSEGKFSITVNRQHFVKPDDVCRELSDGLEGKVKRVTVSGINTEFTTIFLPNRAIVNPINIAPKYTLTLELGDIDALFEPIAKKDKPWEDKGVKQRLQVLGYLYTPLEHPGNNAAGEYKHSRACWEYYKRVHKEGDRNISDTEALDKLKREIEGNLITENFPKSGEIFPKSKLPAPHTFAAIRFPGGYCTTKSPVSGLRAGDHFFNKSNLSSAPEKYDFRIGDRRSDIEKLVFEENEMFGKFPLIANVTAEWPDGRIEPVAGVPVYFQLVMPNVLEPANRFCAKEAPDKVMDYSFDPGAFNAWQKDAPPKISKRVKVKDEERGADGNIIKEAEFTYEDFTPSQEAWIQAKKIASDLAKEAENNGEAEIAKQREEEKSQIEAIAEEIKNNSAARKSRDDLQKEYDQYIKENLDPNLESRLTQAISEESVIRASEPQKKPELFVKNVEKRAAAANADEATKTKARTMRAEYDESLRIYNDWEEKSNAAATKRDQAQAALNEAKSRLKFGKQAELNAAKEKLSQTTVPRNPMSVLETYHQKVLTTAKKERETILDQQTLPEDTKAIINYIFGEAGKLVSPYSAFNIKIYPENVLSVREINDPLTSTAKSAEASSQSTLYRFLLANHGDNPEMQTEIPGVGQKLFIKNLLAEEQEKMDADNPQRRNAPKKYGGRADLPVDGNIFEIQNRVRFNEGHLNFGTLPVAAKGAEKHSVKAETNDKGFAGAVFTPTQCGGDTYRIRVFIDPEWLKPKATGQVHLTVAETGTFVVWRNIRINRYLQLKNPKANFSPLLNETLKTGKFKPNRNPAHEKMRLDTDVVNLSLLPGNDTEPRAYAPVDVLQIPKDNKTRYRPIAVKPVPLENQLNWAYCELIADNLGIEPLSQEEREAALALGLAALQKFWTFSKRIDWKGVVYHDDSSPFLCNFLSFDQYKKMYDRFRAYPGVWPEFDPSDEAEMTAIEQGLQWFYEAMMEYFAGGGVLPGITVIQVPRADTWDLNACDVKTTVTSGYGTGSRGFYISHTEGVYHEVFHIYPATSNAIHEIGHVLALAHQPPAGADIEEAHQDPVKQPFKRPKPEQCVCVMSYSGCYGDLCGKCLMSLRGWAQTHTNNLYDDVKQAEAK